MKWHREREREKNIHRRHHRACMQLSHSQWQLWKWDLLRISCLFWFRFHFYFSYFYNERHIRFESKRRKKIAHVSNGNRIVFFFLFCFRLIRTQFVFLLVFVVHCLFSAPFLWVHSTTEYMTQTCHFRSWMLRTTLCWHIENGCVHDTLIRFCAEKKKRVERMSEKPSSNWMRSCNDTRFAHNIQCMKFFVSVNLLARNSQAHTCDPTRQSAVSSAQITGN